MSLLTICIICAIVNIPYFVKSYYPVHDTLSVFQFFSYFYSEVFLNHALPRWLPYTAFGIPTESYMLFSFGPFQYLIIVFGCLFKIKATLMLFSLSLAIDSLFLGIGAFLFIREISKDKYIALLCVISIFLLIFYDRQIYWNFKILIPLPMILYCIQRFINELKPVYLLWGGALLLCWTFGSISYIFIAQFYILSIYAIASIICNQIFSTQSIKHNLKEQGRVLLSQVRRKDALSTILLPIFVIAVCLMMLIVIRYIINNHMAYNAIGRGHDFVVDLQTYLTYGGNVGPEKLIELFNGLPVSNPHDFLVYIGLVNFGLVFLSVSSIKRNSSHIALLITTVLVTAFSVVGTGVARAAYLLPGMNVIRHIGYFITISKLLLILLTCFGLKELLCGKRYKLIYFIIAGFFCLYYTPFVKTNSYNMHAILVAVFLIVFICISWIFKASSRIILLGCVVIALCDLISYRIIIFKKADLFLVPFSEEFKTVQRSTYKSTRIVRDTDVLKRYFIKPMDIYGIGDSYLREDFCSGSRQDLISPGIKRLFQLRIWNTHGFFDPRNALNSYGDQTLNKILGCGMPKLRLVSPVRYTDDPVVAENDIGNRNDLYEHPVIIASKQERIRNSSVDISEGNNIEVKEFLPNRLHILVRNDHAMPLWLIYSDAFDLRWKVLIDGVYQKIYCANLAFKAFKIAPGVHDIVLILSEPFVEISFMIFAVTLITISLFFIFGIITVLAANQRIKKDNTKYD